MLTIIQRIEVVINNLGLSPAIPFIGGGSQQWGNIVSDDLNPNLNEFIFCLSLPKTTDIIHGSGIIQKKSQMVLFFCSKALLTDTPLQQQPIIAILEQIKDRFLRLATILRDADEELYFNSITNISSQQVINIFDQNVSGIMMTATFEPLENQINICT